jgi:glycogen debranching enzyme
VTAATKERGRVSFKVQVGPPQIAIHHAGTVLVTEPNGEMTWPSDMGLYLHDTRLISAWSVQANGESWDLMNGGAVRHGTARIYLTNREFLTEDGVIPSRTLSLVLSRHLENGLHEDLDITNHSRVAIRFNLEVLIRCDFADIFDVKSNRNIRRGHISSAWSDGQGLTTSYRNEDFIRAVMVTVRPSELQAVYANGRLSFEVRLAPGESWHACLLYTFTAGDNVYAPPSAHASEDAPPPPWRDAILQVQTSNEEFYRTFQQAADDMGALRLPVESTNGETFVPAAGLPWFMAPFGRDSLIASLQNIIVWPEFAKGALNVLGYWQSKIRDPWRDAEPGKIMHELRRGELAHFHLIRHTPYYGTADATPLYLITLHAAWKATGDRSLLETYLPNAEAALRWIDEEGDRDGDMFQEFEKRTEGGYENMCWKDSGDSMTWPDGTLVKGPKALCELQGYVYDAWQRMAEVFDALGQPKRAAEMRAKAAALFKKFNEVFWNEELGFYAYLLDGDKRAVPTITSNAGHLLWSGIVPPDRAARVVARLMAPEMNTGWGIRTLSKEHSAYNPYSYQNGSVWPHDNSLIALGFKRYGFTTEVATLARGISEAASHFMLNQLPELYAGIDRTESPFPVQYLGANVPQAWAAGSVFALLQAILGIEQDAPNQLLWVDPALPRWLPDITLTSIPVGSERLTIRFTRSGEATSFEVLAGDPAHVRRRRFMGS